MGGGAIMPVFVLNHLTICSQSPPNLFSITSQFVLNHLLFPPEWGLLKMTHHYINQGRNRSRLFVRERVELLIELSERWLRTNIGKRILFLVSSLFGAFFFSLAVLPPPALPHPPPNLPLPRTLDLCMDTQLAGASVSRVWDDRVAAQNNWTNRLSPWIHKKELVPSFPQCQQTYIHIPPWIQENQCLALENL